MPPGVPTERDVRVLGRSFAVLVRSVRTHGTPSELAAQRVMELWSALGWPVFLVGPTELTVLGVDALDEPHEARWLLAAFMAGLRSFRPRPGMALGELLRFAEELSRLDTEVGVIETFRDWLWSNGAANIEVELQTSFMEVIEGAVTGSVAAESAVAEGVAAVRAASVRSLAADARTIASVDLDAVGMREEFEAAVDASTARAFDPRVALDPDARESLRARCEESLAWTVEEAAAALANARAMAAHVAPERLAHELTRIMLERFDPDLLDLLCTLARRNDRYARDVLALMRDPAIAEMASLVLHSSDRGMRLLGNFLIVASPGLARTIVHRLLDAASADADQLARASTLTVSVGLGRFCEYIDPTVLTAQEAHGLARLVSLSRGGTGYVAGMLQRMPPRRCLALVVGLDPRQLASMHEPLVELLGALPPSVLSGHVAEILARHEHDGARLLGQVFLMQFGRGWSPDAIAALARTSLAHGLAREFLVPVARSRSAEPGVRSLLLDALASSASVLAEAARWRPAELLDPSPLRDQLRALRGRARRS